jgi:predicted Zn finger-like uncharacterized protein
MGSILMRMVGVTCDKCASRYEFDDADVPPSGKIVKCNRCGGAITVMPAGSAAMGMVTPAAASTVFGLGRGIEPGAGRDDGDGWESLSDGDLVSLGDGEFGSGVDLAALPSPKRASPLSAAAADAESSLDIAFDDDLDLPAPVGSASRSGSVEVPAPGDPTSRGRPDLSGKVIPDLLAPVGPAPTVRSAQARGKPTPERPADKKVALPPLELHSLDDPDLLAPVGPTPTRRLPDLLAPVGPTSHRGAVVPGPKGVRDGGAAPSAPGKPGKANVSDVPAPRGFFEDGLQPSRPKADVSDVPAPKGFFDDGLQPSRPKADVSDVPAPKGFFDDGLQPSRPKADVSDVPAPQGILRRWPPAERAGRRNDAERRAATSYLA